MNVPIFLTQIKDLMLMQNKWASIINPFMSNPSLQSIILPDVALKSGTTVVNHRLGRNLLGWRIVRQRSAASIYDVQDQNQTPSLTLNLVSSAPVSIDLEVF